MLYKLYFSTKFLKFMSFSVPASGADSLSTELPFKSKRWIKSELSLIFSVFSMSITKTGFVYCCLTVKTPKILASREFGFEIRCSAY